MKLSADHRYYLVVLMLLLTHTVCFSQFTITNKAERIFILGGSQVYINGNYVNDVKMPGAIDDPQLIHNGDIFISGNITNNSAANLIEDGSEGIIEFTGSGTQVLDGSSMFDLYDITVNKSAGNLVLSKTIQVDHELRFTSGDLNLNGFNINLGSTGSLINENNANKIFTTTVGVVSYTSLSGPTFGNALGNIGLLLDGVLVGGVTVARGHQQQASAGDGSIQRYFSIDLVPGQTLDALRFYYFDDEIAGFTESQLAPYVSFDNGTSWKKIPGSVTAGSNYIELTSLNITSDFRITLSKGTCSTPPVVNIDPASTDFCAGVGKALDAGTPGAYYTWSTGEATQTITVTESGTYSVNVRYANGCDGNDNVTLTKRPNPVSDFTFGGIICPTTNVSFNNTTSIGPGGGTVTHSWDLGDPATAADVSTNQHASYAYPLAGTYTVTLVSTSQYGCNDTQTHDVTVDPLPTVNFNVTNACLGQSTSFENTSTIAPGYGMTYEWDFDDATTTTETSPVKTFAGLGDFDVALTVTSNAGCEGTLTKNVVIYPTPVSDFTVTNTCEESTIAIVNTSSITTGTLSYDWDFGDATAASGSAPVKSYADPGNFSIELNVMSDHSCSSSITVPIDIYANPDAAFTIDDDCQNQVFPFINASVSTQGSMTYYWDFDDGETSTEVTPNKSFTAAGTYNVALTATTSLGCENTVTSSLTVHPMPVADFSFSNDCLDKNILFTNNSSIISGTLSYLWDFDNSTTSTSVDPSKLFDLAGDYDIALTATSDNGCETSITKPLQVYEMPVVDFGGVIITCGTSYVLDAGNPGSTYAWSDGATSQVNTLMSNGVHSVTVTTLHGCQEVETVDLTLNGVVAPNLGANKVVCGNVLLDAGYPGSTYLWSGGATGRTFNVTFTGTHTVTVTDPNGCVGTDEIFVSVNPVPVVDLGIDIVTCADQLVVLDAANNGSTYAWSNNATSKIISVVTSGLYSVEVTNIFGCKNNDNINVTINPMPVNNLPASRTVCDQVVLDAGNPGASYLWSTGASGRSIDVTSSGAYVVTVKTPENCSLQFTSNIIVNTSPLVDLGADQQLCYKQSALLDAGLAGDTYQWSNGSAGKTLVATESGLYKVQVRRTNGCVTRDSVQVTISPQITNGLNSTYPLCRNTIRVLDATSAQAVSYEWSGVNGFISSNAVINVSDPGKFSVIMKNNIGCQEVDSVEVSSDPDPITARFLVSTFADVGDSLRFVQLSYPDPVSYAWDFADGLASTESNPVHIYKRPDDFNASLMVTDPDACRNSVSKIITIRLLRDEETIELEVPFVEWINSSLYPNPARDRINVDLEFNKEVEIMATLYSLSGKVIETRITKLKNNTLEFDMRSFTSGLYILRIVVNNEIRSMRFIKL